MGMRRVGARERGSEAKGVSRALSRPALSSFLTPNPCAQGARRQMWSRDGGEGPWWQGSGELGKLPSADDCRGGACGLGRSLPLWAGWAQKF